MEFSRICTESDNAAVRAKMLTIKGSAQSTLVIKKSKFLGLAARVDSEEQAQEILAQRKKQHYDASHNCFAHVLENGVMRYGDDGEPQGTAGLPMLDVIKKSGLCNILVISTRYFGGTLLGAGGLVRAYTKSAADSIEAAVKVKIIQCSMYEGTFDYNTWAKAEKLLHDAEFMIDDVQFSDKVQVRLGAMPGSEEELEKLVTSVSLGKVELIPAGILKQEVSI